MASAELITAAGAVVVSAVTAAGLYLTKRLERRGAAESAGVTNGAQQLIAAVAEWKELTADARAAARQAQEDAAAADRRAEEAHHEAARATGKVTELYRHSREQDRRLNALRSVVHAWSEWGRNLHDQWETIRRESAPPPLPSYDPADLD